MPDNAIFYHAAYIAAAVVYGGYIVSLAIRTHRANERPISRWGNCLRRVLRTGIAASLVLGCSEALCQDRWPDPMQDWLTKENAWQY